MSSRLDAGTPVWAPSLAEAIPAAEKPHPGSRGRGSGKPHSPGTWGSSRCGFSSDFNGFWVIFVCFGFTTCGNSSPGAGAATGLPGLRGPGAWGGVGNSQRDWDWNCSWNKN